MIFPGVRISRSQVSLLPRCQVMKESSNDPSQLSGYEGVKSMSFPGVRIGRSQANVRSRCQDMQESSQCHFYVSGLAGVK